LAYKKEIQTTINKQEKTLITHRNLMWTHVELSSISAENQHRQKNIQLSQQC